MKINDRVARDDNAVLDTFAAEITSATYGIALRRGVGTSWVELELDLWRVVAETVEEWGRKSPHFTSPGACEAWWEGLLAELAVATYRTTLRYGGRGSLLESQAGLYQAFRAAIGEKVGNFRRATV